MSDTRPGLVRHVQAGEVRLAQGQLAEMATLIPDCELLTIPAGHLVHAVRPAEFTAAVSSFLRDR